eukprot:CAMPEP_0178408396 /NCGR_PEP_ID=MMETSP0689_2-20121128/19918_1 /TAXON_ID=160604 /ORGANISM="Amphidinium massartii, Strain CS-259" /LENGTH=315 /DNA_ID=CAMNT_0020029491 /DNA_START=106 /DNA_END=1049 /DNA_ORIENTATION=-
MGDANKLERNPLDAEASEDQPLLPPALRPLPKWPTVVALVGAYVLICGCLSFGFGPWSFLASFGLLFLLTMLLGEPIKEQHPAAPWLGLIGLLVVSMAAAIGISNYNAHYSQYLAAFSGRHYANVTTSDPAASLPDASRITFENARPDLERSLGWAGSSMTYCVAPILDKDEKVQKKNATEALPVQYWAVGVDCCSSRGDFHCDNSQVKGSYETRVVREDDDGWGAVFLAPSTRRDSYEEAIDAAASLYHFHAPKPRILVRWTAAASVTSHHVLSTVGILAWSTVLCAAFVYISWTRVQAWFEIQVRRAWAIHQA